jgi:hypothetical protein
VFSLCKLGELIFIAFAAFGFSGKFNRLSIFSGFVVDTVILRTRHILLTVLEGAPIGNITGVSRQVTGNAGFLRFGCLTGMKNEHYRAYHKSRENCFHSLYFHNSGLLNGRFSNVNRKTLGL